MYNIKCTVLNIYRQSYTKMNIKWDIDKQEYTLLLTQKDSFVAKHSQLGDKWIIIIPKEFHEFVKKMKNTLKITVEVFE